MPRSTDNWDKKRERLKVCYKLLHVQQHNRPTRWVKESLSDQVRYFASLYPVVLKKYRRAGKHDCAVFSVYQHNRWFQRFWTSNCFWALTTQRQLAKLHSIVFNNQQTCLWLSFLLKFIAVFLLSPESSLHAKGFSGTAGRTSSLTHTGTQFSTKDRDNDRCTCKCAQLASGGRLVHSTSATHQRPVSICLSL